eukprot:jgi/Chlat1/2652/Chrsp178S02483
MAPPQQSSPVPPLPVGHGITGKITAATIFSTIAIAVVASLALFRIRFVIFTSLVTIVAIIAIAAIFAVSAVILATIHDHTIRGKLEKTVAGGEQGGGTVAESSAGEHAKSS